MRSAQLHVRWPRTATGIVRGVASAVVDGVSEAPGLSYAGGQDARWTGRDVQVGAGLSLESDAGFAAAQAARQAAATLTTAPALAVVFATAPHRQRFDDVAAAVQEHLAPAVAIGALASGVVGPGREVEGGPGVAVWAAADDVGAVTAFRSWSLPQRGGGQAVAGWPDTHPDDLTLLLADPFTFPVDRVLGHLAVSRPGHTVAGGLVTAGRGASRLLVDGRVHEDGAVGVVLRDVDVDAVVSQGCRPVGEPFTVTAAEGQLVLELGGEPATDRLRRLFEEATPEDRDLLRVGLHLGIVTDEYLDAFDVGDFVVRGVLGADEDRGALAVNDVVEVGRTVQFHVLDPASARHDLDHRLDQEAEAVAGSLLFACNGRGRGLFGETGHDVRAVTRHAAEPVAGAFCAGEIGPAGPRVWTHAYSAVVALFRAAEAPPGA